jgi:hypothetical protein
MIPIPCAENLFTFRRPGNASALGPVDDVATPPERLKAADLLIHNGSADHEGRAIAFVSDSVSNMLMTTK